MKDSSPIYINWMLVDPSANNSNLKTELMAFAEKMAKIKGAKSIRLSDLATGQLAKQLFNQRFIFFSQFH